MSHYQAYYSYAYHESNGYDMKTCLDKKKKHREDFIIFMVGSKPIDIKKNAKPTSHKHFQ